MTSGWKIGELARATGLTVRALHHYDRLGLLTPSGRTAAGHRRYAEPDVDRLYRVLALRELGLSLAAIKTVLDGGLDGGPELPGLLAEHLAHVDAQLRGLRALRDRLAGLVAAVDRPGPADLLELIEEMTKMQEMFDKYYTEEQLAQLARRREQIGEQRIADVQAEWPELIAAVRAEVDAGTDPAEPRVQALARRWMALLETFHGGDPALFESMNRMYQENTEALVQRGGPPPELIEYIKRVNAVAAAK